MALSRKVNQAKKKLNRVAAADKKAGWRHETAAYRRANAEVNEAVKSVPWWKR